MRNSKGRFGRGGGAGARRSGCDRRARIAKSRALGPVPLSFHRTPDAAHRRLREPRGPRRAQARVGRPRQGFLEQRGGPPALRSPPHEHRTGQPLARNWHDGLKPRNERKPPILPIVSDELASGQHLFQRHDGTQLRRGERGKKPVSPWSTRSGPAHGVYFVLRVEAGITALHPWNLPRAVEDRRILLLLPVGSHHQDELAGGRWKPVGLLVGARRVLLDVGLRPGGEAGRGAPGQSGIRDGRFAGFCAGPDVTRLSPNSSPPCRSASSDW